MHFFELYHENSRKMPPIGDKERWLESWKTINRKTYPALNVVALPVPKKGNPLEEALRARESSSDFSGKPISFQTLSNVLSLSVGDFSRLSAGTRYMENSEPLFRKTFPSAGARYPLEIYILATRVSDLTSGLYHFNSKEYTLSYLKDSSFFSSKMLEATGYSWTTQAAVLVFITGVFGRTVEKYGERGYRLVLLEAGHAGQNLCVVGNAEGLLCTPLALRDETITNGFIGIDGISEGVVHTVALGL